jgi:hypothetical protein
MNTAMIGVTEDIRDIRGPKVEPGTWLVTGLLAAAVFIAICTYLVRRRHRSGPTIRDLTLLEQTLKRLEATKPLMNPATAREFGSAASEVIRTYIEKRFSVVATQRTTEEFLQSLLQGSNETLARHQSLLAEFLQKCDYVKFAGASLEVSDMESLFQSARTFALETSEQ